MIKHFDPFYPDPFYLLFYLPSELSLSAHGVQGRHHICPQLVGEGKSERKALHKQFLFKQVMWELHTSLVLTVENVATEPH